VSPVLCLHKNAAFGLFLLLRECSGSFLSTIVPTQMAKSIPLPPKFFTLSLFLISYFEISKLSIVEIFKHT
jgi:hypothetical protein